MVKEVVRQVVADVSENTATEDCCCNVPVPVEQKVGEFPEWGCQDSEQCRWHDESKLVHGQIVVDTVENEMEAECDTIIGKKSGKKSARYHSIGILGSLTCRDETGICAEGIRKMSRGRDRGTSTMPTL